MHLLEWQTGLPPAKWLFAANLVAAVAAIAVPVPLAIEYLQATTDRGELLGYLFIFALVSLPTALLLALTAAAHWWRWPLRWLFQGLAIVLPAVVVVLLF